MPRIRSRMDVPSDVPALVDTTAAQHVQETPIPNKCPVCNMKLASRQSLRRHWDNWHQNCDISILNQHLRQIDRAGRPHVCPTCGKAYSRSNILKDHQEKVHQQQGLKRAPRFQCVFTGCSSPASFYFLKDLLQHYESCHTDELGTSKDVHVKTHL